MSSVTMRSAPLLALSTSDNTADHCGLFEQDAHPRASSPTTGFDYAALAPADAADLREHAVRIRGLITKSTACMIEIGGELLTIKERLEHGQFTNWIERELGVGIRTAQSYMAAAKLAEGKCETVALLPPSTVRILAAKSTPPGIVEEVIARVGSGNIVTDAAVKELLAADKITRRQVKREADTAERKSKEGRAARAKKAEAEEVRRLAAQARAEEERRASVQSIFDRFSAEDVAFLADTLTWDNLDEFKRLAAEGAAR